MLLDDIQERIAPAFKRVEAAINLREVIKQPIHADNGAFVVPIAERPAGNSRDTDIGRPLQEINITFGVVIGLKSINDPTGEKGMAALEALRCSCRQKLYGYTPTDHDRILLAASDLVAFAANGIWWLDRFTTTTWYQGETQ